MPSARQPLQMSLADWLSLCPSRHSRSSLSNDLTRKICSHSSYAFLFEINGVPLPIVTMFHLMRIELQPQIIGGRRRSSRKGRVVHSPILWRSISMYSSRLCRAFQRVERVSSTHPLSTRACYGCFGSPSGIESLTLVCRWTLWSSRRSNLLLLVSGRRKRSCTARSRGRRRRCFCSVSVAAVVAVVSKYSCARVFVLLFALS